VYGLNGITNGPTVDAARGAALERARKLSFLGASDEP